MEQTIEIQGRKGFWLSVNSNNKDTLSFKEFLKFKSIYMLHYSKELFLYYSNQSIQVIF